MLKCISISLKNLHAKILNRAITNLIQQLKRIFDPKIYLMIITLKLKSTVEIFMHVGEEKRIKGKQGNYVLFGLLTYFW